MRLKIFIIIWRVFRSIRDAKESLIRLKLKSLNILNYSLIKQKEARNLQLRVLECSVPFLIYWVSYGHTDDLNALCFRNIKKKTAGIGVQNVFMQMQNMTGHPSATFPFLSPLSLAAAAAAPLRISAARTLCVAFILFRLQRLLAFNFNACCTLASKN